MRVFESQSYKNYKRYVRSLAYPFLPSEPMQGALDVLLKFHLVPGKTIKRHKRPCPSVRPDLDNYIKGILDAFNPDPKHGWQGFWKDDAQIVAIEAKKLYTWVHEKPFIEVYIGELVESIGPKNGVEE